jgi:uncharacterized membrane protein YuzA (DUF378 family)
MKDGYLNILAWFVAALAAVNWGIRGIWQEGLFEMAGLTGEALLSVWIIIGMLGVINLVAFGRQVLGIGGMSSGGMSGGTQE